MDVERVASHPCFNLCSLGSSCASKPACLGKHNGFSRRSGQTYLLVADRADLRISQLVWESLFFSDFPDVLDKLIRSWLIEPIYDLYSYPRRSAARHCEIRPPACENLLSSDFPSGR